MANDKIKHLTLDKPEEMEYFVDISKDKQRHRFVDRIEKIIRSSMEYRDYISFLKENVGLDSCVFFNKVTSGGPNKHSRISIEMHHEPFTLYDIVDVVVTKYQEEGKPLNDLDIADEVMELHYNNMVGLVPLSKTMHQVIHNSTKLIVPLNMVYGNYSEFLKEYENYVPDYLYDKLEQKLTMTENLTPESFDAITKEFTYLDIDGVEPVSKMEVLSAAEIA